MKRMILALFLVGCGGIAEEEVTEQDSYAATSNPGYCEVASNYTTGKCILPVCGTIKNTCPKGVPANPLYQTMRCSKLTNYKLLCN
jgi:hypothetical protein